MVPGFGRITHNALLLNSPDDEDEAEKERRRIEAEAQRHVEEALRAQQAHVNEAARNGHDAPREVAARVREAAGNLPTLSATEALQTALAAGADLGVRLAVQAFDGVGIAANWRLVHAQAKSWADHYAYNLIQGINMTTQNQVSTAVGNWVETGDPLDALIEALSPIFGPVRAEKIAQTETTRAYAEGSIQAYEASGVVEEIEWLTVGDAEAEDCDICGPLDHKRVTIGEEFAPGITAPPGHVKCRCRIGAVIKRSVVAMIRRNLAVS